MKRLEYFISRVEMEKCEIKFFFRLEKKNQFDVVRSFSVFFQEEFFNLLPKEKKKKKIIFHLANLYKNDKIVTLIIHELERILYRVYINNYYSKVGQRSPARLQCKVILIACKFRMIKLNLISGAQSACSEELNRLVIR